MYYRAFHGQPVNNGEYGSSNSSNHLSGGETSSAHQRCASVKCFIDKCEYLPLHSLSNGFHITAPFDCCRYDYGKPFQLSSQATAMVDAVNAARPAHHSILFILLDAHPEKQCTRKTHNFGPLRSYQHNDRALFIGTFCIHSHSRQVGERVVVYLTGCAQKIGVPDKCQAFVGENGLWQADLLAALFDASAGTDYDVPIEMFLELFSIIQSIPLHIAL